MLSQGTLSPMEDIQSLIKGKIGEFLSAETTIRRLQSNASASIRAQASALLSTHKLLELDLADAQTKIELFKKGSWSIGDVITLGDVGTRMLQHLGKVRDLDRQAGGFVPGSLMPTGVLPALLVAGVVGGVFLFMRK